MDDTRSSSGLSTMVLWTLGVLLLFGGILAGLYSTMFDTQYAPGYSEKAFRSIKLGDTEQRVLALIGNPFTTNETEPFVEWIYSGEVQKQFAKHGTGEGTYTTLRFDATGRVQSAFGQRQTSGNSITIGDGQNHLNLTKQQIQELKGSSQDEIRQKFGVPNAVYEYKATKLLSYSRSPSGSHYHLRMIGLDKDGKVVHIGREVYWD